MMKIIFPLLLTLLLFACSTNQTAAPQMREGCTQIDLMKHVPAFRAMNDNILANFYDNLPGIREGILFTVEDIDQHREQMALVLDTPGFLNPEMTFLRHLISDELLDYNKNLPALDLTELRKEIKNYIPDYEKFRCNYILEQDYSQLCK